MQQRLSFGITDFTLKVIFNLDVNKSAISGPHHAL